MLPDTKPMSQRSEGNEKPLLLKLPKLGWIPPKETFRITEARITETTGCVPM